MSSTAALSRSHLLAMLAAHVSAPAWRERLRDLQAPEAEPALHIAVMHRPYLQHLLDGRKTIESRFSVNRICPFEAVAPGDVLALKVQSGPVVGLAAVEHVAFYELDPETWETLRRDFAGPLCASDDDFWQQRAHARYASLLRVHEPIRISPVAVEKTDRRGWVRFPGADAQQSLQV